MSGSHDGSLQDGKGVEGGVAKPKEEALDTAASKGSIIAPDGKAAPKPESTEKETGEEEETRTKAETKTEAKKDVKFDVAKESKAIADLVYQMNVNVERFASREFRNIKIDEVKENGQLKKIERDMGVTEDYPKRPHNIFQYDSIGTVDAKGERRFSSKFAEASHDFKETLQSKLPSLSSETRKALTDVIDKSLSRAYEAMINGVAFDESKFKSGLKEAKEILENATKGEGFSKENVTILQEKLEHIQKEVVKEQLEQLKKQLIRQKDIQLATLLTPMDGSNVRDWIKRHGREQDKLSEEEKQSLLGIRDSASELATEGIYRRVDQNPNGWLWNKKEEKFSIWWQEKGVVVPLGEKNPLSGSDFREGYEQAFDFVKAKMRSTKVLISFPGLEGRGYTEGAMSYAIKNLDTLLDIAQKKGVQVDLDGKMLAMLGKYSAKKQLEYIDKVAALNNSLETKITEAKRRTDTFRQERVDINDMKEKIDITNTKRANQKEPDVARVIEEMKSLDDRSQKLQATYTDLTNKKAKLESELSGNDKKEKSNSEKVKWLVKLMDEVSAEQKDIQSRLDICKPFLPSAPSLGEGKEAKAGVAEDGQLAKIQTRLNDIKPEDMKKEVEKAIETARTKDISISGAGPG